MIHLVISYVLAGVVISGAAAVYAVYSYWEFRPDLAPPIYRERRSSPMPPEWVLPFAINLANGALWVWMMLLAELGHVPRSAVGIGLTVCVSICFWFIMVPTLTFDRPRFLISKARQDEMRREHRGRRRRPGRAPGPGA